MDQQPASDDRQSGPARTISRRALLRYGLAATGSVVLGGFPRIARAQGRGRVQILIVVDTLRCNALGCYGNPLPVTPAIDAIAADGVRFAQAISTSGWTLPAIVSMLTGTWPAIHGAKGKGAKLTGIRKEVPTAAEIFRQNGFRTLGWGNCAFVSPLLGLDRGFDVYDARHAFTTAIRRADETVTAAIGQLPSRRDQDVFLFLHLFDPHLDYDPPAGYGELFTGGRTSPPLPLGLFKCKDLQTNAGQSPPLPADIAYVQGAYYGEVRFTDDQIGRLVQELKRRDLYDACTLVIAADHGEEFWEHGGFEHGHTVYDELIHVPLILKLPSGSGEGGRVVSTQVRTLDIPPTLFQIAGIEGPTSMDGTSLLPHIAGQTEVDLPAMSESTLYGTDKVSWRTGPYKYMYDMNTRIEPHQWLFDLRRDPQEQENLMEMQPDVAAAVRAQCEAFQVTLLNRARAMSRPRVKDLSPHEVESLKSLGYIR